VASHIRPSRQHFSVAIAFVIVLTVAGFVQPQAAQAQYLFTVTVQVQAFGEPPDYSVTFPFAAICKEKSSQVFVGPLLFSLPAGGRKLISNADFPSSDGNCQVAQLDKRGADRISYQTSSPRGSVEGVMLTEPNWFASVGIADVTVASAVTNAGIGQSIVVADYYFGDLLVTRTSVGLAPTNVATSASITCNNNGPRESFTLRNQESKLFSGVFAGTACIITPVPTDGASVVLADNWGFDTNSLADGRVVLKGSENCGGVSVVSQGRCRSLVFITDVFAAPPTTTPAASVPPSTLAVPATIQPTVAATLPRKAPPKKPKKATTTKRSRRR
jgi:hypothetical protein